MYSTKKSTKKIFFSISCLSYLESKTLRLNKIVKSIDFFWLFILPKLNCLNHSACLYNTLSVCTTTTTTLLYHLQPIRQESVVSIDSVGHRKSDFQCASRTFRPHTFGRRTPFNQFADLFGPIRGLSARFTDFFGRPLSAGKFFGKKNLFKKHFVRS